MQNTPISQQIEDMIRGRAARGPGMIKQYGSSLEAAAGQEQESIDDLRSIYSDPSKFETSKWGALGLGLMKGTKSGSFNESLYNGLAAASAAQEYNREQNLSREEKLAKLSALQAQLTRQQANDTLGVYDKQTDYITSAQADQQTLADIELAKSPKGPRPLAPGEFGPEAPGSDYLSRSMTIYNDYLTNPQNYAGPKGRALVEDAINLIKNERTNARYEATASMRTQSRPTLTSRDKAIMDDAVTQNNQLKQTLLNIEEAEALGPNTWSGIAPNSRARVTSWWYGNEGQDDTTSDEHLRYQQIMEGEAIAQMSATLKGATTDREMQKFIDILADPSVPWNSTKKHALAQVKRFAQSVIAMNEEKISGIRDGSYWTGEGGTPAASAAPELGFNPETLPPEVKSWVEEQIDGGAPEEQIIEYLRENYGEAGQ